MIIQSKRSKQALKQAGIGNSDASVRTQSKYVTYEGFKHLQYDMPRIILNLSYQEAYRKAKDIVEIAQHDVTINVIDGKPGYPMVEVAPLHQREARLQINELNSDETDKYGVRFSKQTFNDFERVAQWAEVSTM